MLEVDATSLPGVGAVRGGEGVILLKWLEEDELNVEICGRVFVRQSREMIWVNYALLLAHVYGQVVVPFSIRSNFGILPSTNMKLPMNSAMRTAFEILSSCSYGDFRRACSKLAVQVSALDLSPATEGHKSVHRHLCY